MEHLAKLMGQGGMWQAPLCATALVETKKGKNRVWQKPFGCGLSRVEGKQPCSR